jgi:hypothetical protein
MNLKSNDPLPSEGGLSLIARVKARRDQRPRLSLREIAAELEREGRVTAKGTRYSASAIQSSA